MLFFKFQPEFNPTVASLVVRSRLWFHNLERMYECVGSIDRSIVVRVRIAMRFVCVVAEGETHTRLMNGTKVAGYRTIFAFGRLGRPIG